MISIIKNKIKNINKNNLNKFYFLFQILITIIMCYLFYDLVLQMDINLINLIEDKTKLLILITLVLALFFLRSVRLFFLFDKNISVKSSTLITIKSYTVNNIFPFRLGEIYRIIAVKKKIGINYKKATFFLIVERVIDFIFFLTLLTIGAVFIFFLEKYILYYTFLLAIIFVFIVLLFKNYFVLVQNFLIDKFKEFYEIMLSFILVIPNILIVTFLIFLIEVLIYYKSSVLIGIDIPLFYLFYMVGASNILPIFLPTPGGVGSFEYVIIGILTYNLSYGKIEAINYALFTHFILIIPITILGILLFILSFLKNIKN